MGRTAHCDASGAGRSGSHSHLAEGGQVLMGQGGMSRLSTRAGTWLRLRAPEAVRAGPGPRMRAYQPSGLKGSFNEPHDL